MSPNDITRRSVVLVVLAVATVGCSQQMANEGRIKPLEASQVFDNGMSAREPVEGTIARGQLQLDDAFFQGKVGGELVTSLPERALVDTTLPMLLAHGKLRFEVYCSHCHGLVGGGTGGPAEYEQMVGMVVLRGFPAPPTFHQDRLREVPIGHFFDVITNGLGRMPAHDYLVVPEDRWAIAAYIRALQLSQHIPRDQVPQDLLDKTRDSLAETSGRE
jgi:mono/diheme cytochrome c family protein